MTLVGTSLLSLVATFTKMLAGLAISKALAVYVGPTGMAVVGQFQNFVQLALTAGKAGIDTGVTKYTAERRGENEPLARLFGTALRISLIASVSIGVALIVTSREASQRILHSDSHAYVFVVFGITLGMFVLNNLLLAILNGLHEIRTYIGINIFQNLFSLAFTAGLIALFGLDGALIALVTNQSVTLLLVLVTLRRHPLIRRELFRAAFDRGTGTQLGRYAMMTVVSTIAVPVTTMLVRDHIARTMGLTEAGYWQAAWYVSSVYLSVVTTSLSVYYLPKLASLSDKGALRAELRAGYAVVLPLMAAITLLVYAGRDLILRTVFTEAFAPMLDLLPWLLVGDVVKMASWLLSYLMVAKAMTSAFIATEVMFSASFVVLCMVLTPSQGLEGVMQAHALNYAVYLLAVGWLTRRFWA